MSAGVSVAALALAGCSVDPADPRGDEENDLLAQPALSAPVQLAGGAGACGAALEPAGAQASVAQVGNEAPRAVDGDLATRWSGLGKGASVTVDLGASRDLCEIGIAWYSGASRKSHFTVALSADGADFEEVFAGDSSGSTEAIERYPVTGDARYVKITVNGNTQNDWASISEIAAFAPDRAGGFRHPGILVSREQLQFVKARLNQEPWRTEIEVAKSSSFAKRTPRATPNPHKDEQSGRDQRSDAIAAYTQALLWNYTGDETYARRAIAILDAWSSTLQGLAGEEYALQAAWVAEVITRAAELMRHTYAGWPQDRISAFEQMLKSKFLPAVQNGWSGNGNWELSMIEALMNIAVFTDDQASFDRAVTMWKRRVRAYIYMSGDGPTPVIPLKADGTVRSYERTPEDMQRLWKNPTAYVDGLAQETCRDLSHVAMGMGAMMNTAETAWLQGVDLYAAEERRLRAGLEFLSRDVLPTMDHVEEQLARGVAPEDLVKMPSNRCKSGTLDLGGNGYKLTGDIAYNAFANRAGAPSSATSLPYTLELLERRAPYKNRSDLHMAWERLTHAQTGRAGEP